MSILIQHFPNWITEGLFSKLGDWVPWANDEDVDINALDIEYFGNRSGYRMSSPLIDKMTCYPYDVILSDEQIARISSVIRAKYNKDWTRLWNALQEEYNPIQNYDMTESGADTALAGGSISDQGQHSLSRSEDDNRRITNTVNSKIDTSTTDTSKVKPLGSNSFVETRQTTGSGNTTQNSQYNEADSSDVADIDVSETGSNSNTQTRNLTENKTHQLTRSGNIGVTTSQQMLESEYQLRTKHFFDMVFEDVDKILTIPYWG